MRTPDAPLPRPPSFEDLRARLAALPGDPTADLDDFQRLAARARDAEETERDLPALTEVRVRLAGKGVEGNHVPVHHATQLLDLVQGTITAVASASRKRDKVKPPKDRLGRRVGVREATELRMGPEVAPGSLIFHLVSSPHLVPDSADGISGTEVTDAFVDVAVRQTFDVLAIAESDDGADIGHLTEAIRRQGSIVASKLSQLATRALEAEIDLDLGHLSQAGTRRRAALGSRGAAALRAAAERNQQRIEAETIVGVLRTVSDGSDQLRVKREDGKDIRINVTPELGVTLGPLLGRKVVLEVEADVRWNLSSGKETRTRHLVSAELAPEVQALPGLGEDA